MEKNKKNYKKNNYQKKYKNSKTDEKKVTYDSLVNADTITEIKQENNDFDKVLVMKYIAVSVILLAIIIVSLILFRKM